jgi:type IV pilus assembly protein PilY1
LVNSIYVFKDPLTTTPIGNLRADPGMVQQTMQDTVVSGQNTRRLTVSNAVDWSTNSGWFIDLSLTSGERVNVEMLQSSNLLTVASNIPTSTVCTPGGSSWEYFFDITNGNIADAVYGDAMTAGLNLVKIGNGLKIIRWNIRGEPDVRTPGTGIGTPVGTLRRISWRELVN